ncbi:MAG: hypothetical protein KAW49_15435 [Anaerolineae bacterium]|nr:hypothetical protein [Anaerolineae bacterium]MCK4473174.1 hypothetical protein [Anaerolineae bacterium]
MCEEIEAVPDDLIKLRVLLPHWIEHNEEHAESFREWAGKAREMGLEAVAKQIETAVKRMDTCNETLAAAIEELQEG